MCLPFHNKNKKRAQTRTNFVLTFKITVSVDNSVRKQNMLWETVEVTFRSVLKTLLKSLSTALLVFNSLKSCYIFILLLERSVLNLRTRLQSLRFNKGVPLALTGVNSDRASEYAFLARAWCSKLCFLNWFKFQARPRLK